MLLKTEVERGEVLMYWKSYLSELIQAFSSPPDTQTAIIWAGMALVLIIFGIIGAYVIFRFFRFICKAIFGDEIIAAIAGIGITGGIVYFLWPVLIGFGFMALCLGVAITALMWIMEVSGGSSGSGSYSQSSRTSTEREHFTDFFEIIRKME